MINLWDLKLKNVLDTGRSFLINFIRKPKNWTLFKQIFEQKKSLMLEKKSEFKQYFKPNCNQKIGSEQFWIVQIAVLFI